ncbi:MAG: right-handed parallel beta-helix repeat-containing protein [Gemmatimonadetes bacterium]|nr:right-handed parallel beta-helix repeat-containing protein [Gemmatimonadota bacterium]
MKRVLLLLGLTASLVRALPAQTVTARVGGELTGFVGDYVTVPIVADLSAAGGAKLGSYTARLAWDTAALSASCYYGSCDVLPGNFPNPQFNTDSISAGVLRFGALSPLGVDGLVTLAQLRFYVDSALASPLTLSFTEMSAAGTFTDLLPSLSVTSAMFCVAKGRWGDLDRDERANSRDALAILSNVVGVPVDSFFHVDLGDVDGDTKVNSRDALIVLSYAVGLAIPGQRVLLPAPSSCGTGAATQLAVFPSSAELTLKQTLQLATRGLDAAGNGVTIPDAIWRSSDYTVAGVTAEGMVEPRSPGSAVITAAIGPGLKAQATITIIARRPHWYVDLLAEGNPVQIGTVERPFDHPIRAFAAVSEGDTIHVASGTYLFQDDGNLPVGATILGGTPGDTTTRPVFLDSDNDYTGLWLTGGNRTVLRNVVLDDFYYGVDIDGARNFIMEDSKILLRANSYGYGISSCGGPVDTIRVERSSLLATDSSGYAMELDGCARVGLLSLRDTRVSLWDYGLYLYEVDSTAIVNSEISLNDGYGIYSSQEDVVNPALYIAHSQISRNYYEGVYGYDFRRVVIDTSTFFTTDDDAIDVEGSCCGGVPMQFYMHGSTIEMHHYADDYNWLYLDDADSVVIDSSTIRFADSTYFYGYADVYADKLWLTNTKFVNLGYGTGLYFDGRLLFADSLVFSGCTIVSPGCAGASALEAYLYGTGAYARVQRSRFTNQGYPLYLEGSGVQSVENVVIDSAYNGFESYDADSVFVSNAVLTRIQNRGLSINPPGGISGRGPTVLAGNTVTCNNNAGTGRAIDYGYGRYVVQNNMVTGCYYGIYAALVKSGSVLSHNTVRNAYYGITIDQPDTVTVRVDSNAVSGSTSAGVYQLGSAHLFLTGNNVQNNSYGLYLPYSTGLFVHQVHENAFVGNASYGIIASYDTVAASRNWWGLATGANSGPGADNTSGRIGTDTALAAAPSGLPPLAPAVALAPAVPSTVTAPQAPERSARPRPAKASKVRPAMRAPAIPTVSPERAARIQRSSTARAAHEAKDAERRQEREARRAARATVRTARQ